MDERKMYVREDDAMGCEECFEDYLDDGAILPAHLHIHKELDAGICGLCGYVLDPTMSGYAEQLAKVLRDAAALARHTNHIDAERAFRAENRPDTANVGVLVNDLREATRAILAMAEKLTDAGVDKSALDL